jgi:hypothetical protein
MKLIIDNWAAENFAPGGSPDRSDVTTDLENQASHGFHDSRADALADLNRGVH